MEVARSTSWSPQHAEESRECEAQDVSHGHFNECSVCLIGLEGTGEEIAVLQVFNTGT